MTTQTPLIDTSTPAINAAPVEIDGAEMSVGDMEARRRANGGSTGADRDGREGSMGVISPGDEEDIDGEFLGDGRPAVTQVRTISYSLLFYPSHLLLCNTHANICLGQKRAAMLASRSKDPGVIVDVPKDPTAEEVEAAKSAEGTITPGLPPPGLMDR